MSSTQAVPGIVLFDDPISRGPGWACSFGEVPKRIASASELSNAAVWLTNLDDQRMRESGLATNRFRAQDYLRVNLVALACEVGCARPINNGLHREASGPECAQDLAGLFGNVMDVSLRFGIETFPPFQLRIGYRRAHYRAPQADSSPMEAKDALRHACQRYTTSERTMLDRKDKYEERTTIFVRHRYWHATDLISLPVPVGPWRAAPRMTPQEIDEHPRPLLLEVEVQNLSDEVGAIVNFGGATRSTFVRGGVRQIDASPRRWMTQPEYRYLRQHGRISVHSILEAESFRENPLAQFMPRYDLLQSISPAFLLAIESLWTCVYRDERGGNDFSAVSAWMSAYDRLACLSDAIRLRAKDPGVDIAGFGYGRIIVKTVNPGARFGAWCWDMVQGTSLIPPLAVDGPFSAPIQKETDPIEVLQAIQLAGDKSTLLGLDNEALRDFDEQVAALSVGDVASA